METGISSGLMGHFARMQTLPYLTLPLGEAALKFCSFWARISLLFYSYLEEDLPGPLPIE